MSSFVTVVHGSNYANKLYIIENGEVVKTPPKYENVRTAHTVKVEDLTHLKLILEWLSELENSILILGYIEGTTEYNLISESELKRLTGLEDVKGVHDVGGHLYAARLKKTFKQSAFFVFDRDEVDGMPKELIHGSHYSWWHAMCKAYLMLNGCGYLLNRSNSGRVYQNGKCLSNDNQHVYLEAKNPDDIGRFGKAALIHAFSRGVGFMKKNKNGGFRPWSIFDPTTFSREREVYDGKPTVIGEGLEVVKNEVVYVGGAVVDTEQLESPTIEQQNAVGMNLHVTNEGNYQIHDNVSLKFDTVIDFKEFGKLTLREFIDNHDKKARCQSPFRSDSSSMAAYVNFTKGGDPFLHDVGTGTNYYISLFEFLDGVPPVSCELVVDVPPPLIFNDKIRVLDLAVTDKEKQLEIAKALVLEVDRLDREDLKIEYNAEICSVMGWSKANFAKVLKSYKSLDVEENSAGWLLENIVLLNEGNGGYYNLDVGCYQIKTVLNDNYAHLNLGDESPANIVNFSGGKQVAQGLGWQPTDLKFFQYSHKTYVNTNTPPQIVPVAGDVTPWLILMNHIYGDYAHLVLRHMAFTLQYPAKKIRWQIMTWGKPRTGKSFTLVPLIKILGNSAGDVTNEMLEAGWDDIWSQKKVVVFNEIMQGNKADSKKVFNHLKSKFSDDSVEHLNIKGGGVMLQQNYYSMYMFSNYEDALMFDVNQEKLLVIESPDHKLEEGFYKELDRLVNTEKFIAACYHFLLNIDVSEFEYSKLPVTTQAAHNMAAAAKHDYELTITEWIEDEVEVFKTGVFKFKDLKNCLVDNHIRCSDKNIARVLEDNGYKKLKFYSRKAQKRGTYWTNKPELIENPSLVINNYLEILL